MWELRSFGGLCGLGFIIYGIFLVVLRKRNHQRQSLIVMAMGTAFILISARPDLVSFITGIIVKPGIPFYRIYSLLIASVIGLFIGFVILYNRLENSEMRLTLLVRNNALMQFEKEFKGKALSGSILIILPAYNEAESLKRLLPLLPKEFSGRKVNVLVVVDGGVDGSGLIAKENGCLVVQHAINCGGGAALQTGYFLARRLKAEIVVTMDADGQHLPEDLPKLIDPLLNNEADLTCGSRVRGQEKEPIFMRKAGIIVFNSILSLLLMRRITDSSNAFRAIHLKNLQRLELKQTQFHTSEFLIEAIYLGLKVIEVPVVVHPRFHGESKKPRSLRYGYGYFRAILKTYYKKR